MALTQSVRACAGVKCAADAGRRSRDMHALMFARIMGTAGLEIPTNIFALLLPREPQSHCTRISILLAYGSLYYY